MLFMPTNLPNCEYWFSRDYGVFISSGTNSTVMTDRSGNARNFIQNTDANRAFCHNNQANGKPILRFNGSTHNYTITDLLNLGGTSGYTLFFILKPTINNSTRYIFTLNTNNTNGGLSAAYRLGITGEVGVRVQGSEIYNAALSTNKFSCLTIEKPSGGNVDSHKAYINNTELSASSRVNGTSTMNIQGAVSAVATYAGSNFYSGDIAEIIVYSRELSTQERTLLWEQYIQPQYNLV